MSTGTDPALDVPTVKRLVEDMEHFFGVESGEYGKMAVFPVRIARFVNQMRLHIGEPERPYKYRWDGERSIVGK